jgi:hypothetical protein
MRTNQLLTARRNTQEQFFQSLERVYGMDLDQDVSQTYSLDHAILHLD